MNRHEGPSGCTARVRTSATHPLRINALPAGSAGGQIGITFCPGTCGPSASDYHWERDFAADLDVIQSWGASAVLTLVEDHELHMLSVPTLGHEVRALGIAWYHLPIVDVAPPDDRFEAGWREAGPTVRAMLSAGGRVLAHCRGGLGRAGRSRHASSSSSESSLGTRSGEYVPPAREPSRRTPRRTTYFARVGKTQAFETDRTVFRTER